MTMNLSHHQTHLILDVTVYSHSQLDQLPLCLYHQTSSKPDIYLSRPPSSLSEFYVGTGPLFITSEKPLKPSPKLPTSTPSNHQFSTPAKLKRRCMNSGNNENSLSGFEAFLSKELAAASKEREATRETR